MSRQSLFAAPFVAALLLSTAACGGIALEGPGDGGTTNDAGSDGASKPPIGDPPSKTDASPPTSGLILPPDGTLSLAIDGGFAANGTDTSACTMEHLKFTYDAASQTLVWEQCQIADGGARNDLIVGKVILTAAQVAALNLALADVRIVGIVSTCGSDLPEEVLQISSPEAFAPDVYYDQFTRCGDRTITHVTNLAEVENVLADATK